MRTKAMVTTALMLAMLMTAGAVAQQVEFNYNGVVKVQGQPFDGEGEFKFSIVDKSGNTTFWANDGETLDGTEPTSTVLSTVVDGFFSINIGDTETTGTMAPLYATMFNARDRVKLRTWFSDGIGDFERLRPDREITNPAILGSQSLRETDIYVDPATGDDSNTGLEEANPKQTIQGAWDAVPSLLRTTATIHLADGVYREEVLLTGKTPVGDTQVIILGNVADPDAVRITGSDAGDDTTPVRDYGFHLDKQGGVRIEGVLVDYAAWYGIFVEQTSEIDVLNSHVQHNYRGIYIEDSSHADLTGVVASHGSAADGTSGINVGQLSNVNINGCTISTQTWGLSAGRNSIVYIDGLSVDNCTVGVYAVLLSTAYFLGTEATISNCTYGSRARYLSVLAYPERSNVTYTSCGTRVLLGEGSYEIP